MLDVRKEIQKLTTLQKTDVSYIEENSVCSNDVDRVVTLYNQAIYSLQSKSDDIAAIELKKALAIFPEFIEAKVLLGLCYITAGQMEQAEQVLKSIAENNSTYTRAYRYLRYAEQFKDKSKTNRQAIRKLKFTTPSKLELKINKSVIKIIVGFLIGVSLTYIFSYSTIASLRKQNSSQQTEWNEHKITYDRQIEGYRTTITKNQQNVEQLQRQIKDKEDTIQYLEYVKKLIEVEQLINESQKEAAGDMLLTLANVKYQNAEKDRYKDLYSKVIPPLANELYYKGYNNYQAKQYDKAITFFQQSLKYESKGEKTKYVLYFMGRCYQTKGDKLRAANYYNKLVNEFPDDIYAQYASNRLEQLKKD